MLFEPLRRLGPSRGSSSSDEISSKTSSQTTSAILLGDTLACCSNEGDCSLSYEPSISDTVEPEESILRRARSLLAFVVGGVFVFSRN